jgi:hypothetical protein
MRLSRLHLRTWWVMTAIACLALQLLVFKTIMESCYICARSQGLVRMKAPWETWEFSPFHRQKP